MISIKSFIYSVINICAHISIRAPNLRGPLDGIDTRGELIGDGRKES